MWFPKKRYQVICVGSCSQDIFFPTDEGIVIDTPEDITAKQKIAFELGGKYQVADRHESVGGVAANVSVGLARLGHTVAPYSCVGDDEMGKFIMGVFNDERIATDLMTVLSDSKTDLSAIVVVIPSGERTIFHNRDANERLSVMQEKLKNTEWLFVSALNGDWRKNLATLRASKKAFGLKIAFNPGQHNIREDAAVIIDVLRETEVLLLNKDEAIELLMQMTPRPSDTDLDDELILLEKLHQAGAAVIGMTDGKRGAWGYDGAEYWYCPIHTKDTIVDSTGCGDSFASGFFAAHLAGATLARALQYGMGNSGSVIGYYGAIEGLLRPDEMEKLTALIVPQRLR